MAGWDDLGNDVDPGREDNRKVDAWIAFVSGVVLTAIVLFVLWRAWWQ